MFAILSPLSFRKHEANDMLTLLMSEVSKRQALKVRYSKYEFLTRLNYNSYQSILQQYFISVSP